MTIVFYLTFIAGFVPKARERLQIAHLETKDATLNSGLRLFMVDFVNCLKIQRQFAVFFFDANAAALNEFTEKNFLR